MSRNSNASDRDRKKRRRLREKLRAEGMSEELIDQVIDRQRHADLIAREGEDRAREIRRRMASRDPDDAGFKPSPGDPLLRGPARVQGVTAKVVRRSHTITEYQYDRMPEVGSDTEVTP